MRTTIHSMRRQHPFRSLDIHGAATVRRLLTVGSIRCERAHLLRSSGEETSERTHKPLALLATRLTLLTLRPFRATQRLRRSAQARIYKKGNGNERIDVAVELEERLSGNTGKNYKKKRGKVSWLNFFSFFPDYYTLTFWIPRTLSVPLVWVLPSGWEAWGSEERWVQRKVEKQVSWSWMPHCMFHHKI